MIKGIRRSFKGDKRTSSGSSKSNGGTASPQASAANQSSSSSSGSTAFAKPNPLATTPPKKIIKALYDYSAQGPGELSFSKGDFLYVIGHENDDDWYEAFDPPSNLQGMVPVAYFEVVSRQETIPTVPIAEILNNVKKDPQLENGQSSLTGVASSSSTTTAGPGAAATAARSGPSSLSPSPMSGLGSVPSKAAPLYGVVLYNFVAERPDELQASAGESIIVIAESNEEWFVAKPIGRLGGPGLIPVSYIQLREVGSDKAVTDIQAAVKRAGVPRVEEWKRMAAEYKASSITLGKFEDDTVAVSRQMQAMSIREQPSSQQLNAPGIKSTTNNNGPLPSPATSSFAEANSYNGRSTASSSSYGRGSLQGSPGIPYVVRASVDRYAFHGGRYWYLLVCELSNGKHRNLCRYYQDFYDFQIKLLDEFPDEAGRTGKQRSLPFMPGPLTYVNDSISSQRRVNLDEYVRKLVQLPAYISRSPVVLQLFSIKAGDIEAPTQSGQMPQPLEPGTPSSVAPFSSSSGTVSTSQESPPPELQEEVAIGSEESLTTPSALNYHSRMASQATVTEPAATSVASPPLPPAANGKVGSMVKIKVFHNDDLIAIRFPSDADFQTLQDKITERLNLSSVRLLYKDKLTDDTIELSNDAEFSKALNGKTKLVLYAKTE